MIGKRQSAVDFWGVLGQGVAYEFKYRQFNNFIVFIKKVVAHEFERISQLSVGIGGTAGLLAIEKACFA